MNVNDPNQKICLSVRITNGVVKLADGTALPRISDGTLADLLVPTQAIQQINEEEIPEDGILLLGKGSILWARVNSNEISPHIAKFRTPKRMPDGKSMLCVEINLKQDLRLVAKNKKPSLSPCICFIPALQQQVESVNEAYTKISLAFEPKRRSNAGNVFLVVFVEQDAYVVSLDTLRRDKT